MKKIKNLKSILIPTIATATLAASASTAVILTQPNKSELKVSATINAATQYTITYKTEAYKTTDTSIGTSLGTATLKGKTSVKIKANREFSRADKPVATLGSYSFAHWAYVKDGVLTEIKSTNIISSNMTLYPIFLVKDIGIGENKVYAEDATETYVELDLSSLCGTGNILKADGTTYSTRADFNKPVIIGSEVITIPNGFLAGCTTFDSKIWFANDDTHPAQCLIIGDDFMSGCTAYDGITITGDYDHSINLTSLEKLQMIKSNFFKGCTTLGGTTGLVSLDPTLFNLDKSTNLALIGDSFLEGCTNFTMSGTDIFTLPSGLLHVGERFIFNCNSLTQIMIPVDASVFASSAFSFATTSQSAYQTGITVLYAVGQKNSSIKTAFPYVFTSAKTETNPWRNLHNSPANDGTFLYDLTSTSNGNTATITGFVDGYTTSETTLTIPTSRELTDPTTEETKTYTITDIADRAFVTTSGSTIISTIPETITKVVFEEEGTAEAPATYSSLSTIGAGAFYNCQSITDVIFPKSLTEIGESAFQYCSNLNSITLHRHRNDVYLRPYAFADCANAGSITLESHTDVTAEETGYFTESKINDWDEFLLYLAWFNGVGIKLVYPNGNPESWTGAWTISNDYESTTWGDKPIADDETPVSINDITVDDDLNLVELTSEDTIEGNVLIIPKEIKGVGSPNPSGYSPLLQQYSGITKILFETRNDATNTCVINGHAFEASEITTVDFNDTVITSIGNTYEDETTGETKKYGFSFADCAALTTIGASNITGMSLTEGVVQIPSTVTLIQENTFTGCDVMNKLDLSLFTTAESITALSIEDLSSETAVSIDGILYDANADSAKIKSYTGLTTNWTTKLKNHYDVNWTIAESF